MLEEMRIRQLGVIEDAVLELSSGLTVVTGETGAGKTMVVTGLGLLLGARADAALVRSGSAKASVEGRFVVAAGSATQHRVDELGGDLEDGALIVSRTVSAEGRSRAAAGGTSVPSGVLGEIADDLVAVHGQNDQQRLLQPARQRAALDRFAGADVARPLADYRERYHRWRAVTSEIDELEAQAQQRVQEADALRFGLEAVEAVDPKPSEDVALSSEAERLAHAETLTSAAATAHAALVGDDDGPSAVDAATFVAQARKALDAARAHDGDLGALADRLSEIGHLVEDAAADLASYAQSVDADPTRLAAVEDRRAALGGLIRRYAADAAEDESGADVVLRWAEGASRRLLEIEGTDDRRAALVEERDALRTSLEDLATQVSAARADAATRLGAAVSTELDALAMPHAELVVGVDQREAADGLRVGARSVAFGADGVDDVELRLRAHPGAPARPLAKGASGGELSRVMLALEVVLAGADPVPTFVFDEVDAGVGGRAAVEVGARLARLARTSQVLVVTHLPQVAAFADVHLVVDKSDDGVVTRSGVTALDDDARRRELARMLAGLADSELGQAHADELIEVATSTKAAP